MDDIIGPFICGYIIFRVPTSTANCEGPSRTPENTDLASPVTVDCAKNSIGLTILRGCVTLDTLNITIYGIKR